MLHGLCLSLYKAVAALPLTLQILVPGQEATGLMRSTTATVLMLLLLAAVCHLTCMAEPLINKQYVFVVGRPCP